MGKNIYAGCRQHFSHASFDVTNDYWLGHFSVSGIIFCIIKEGVTMDNKSVSLDGLSVSDLTVLQAQIEEQIKARHAEEKQDVKKRILALLDEYGFTLGDIFPSAKGQAVAPGASKKTVRIRYSDGQNTWAGRGRMPLWVKTFIQSGGKLDSLDVLK